MSEIEPNPSWQPELPGLGDPFMASNAMVKAVRAKIESLALTPEQTLTLAAEIQLLYSLAHELDVAFAAGRKTIAHVTMIGQFKELLGALPESTVSSVEDPYEVFLDQLNREAELHNVA